MAGANTLRTMNLRTARRVCFTVVFSAVAFAEEPTAPAAAPPPSADELKRVLDYQDNGKDRGPVLLDVVACKKVDTEKGPTQFTCIEPVSGPVKKGTVVNAWVQFFCPKDGNYEDISVQWVLDGEPRATNDVVVKGYARTRTWKAQSMTKPGKWEIRVKRGATVLGTASVVVEN